MASVFAVPVFFVCFRECLETAIIVSILLSMLKQTLDPVNDPKTYKKLRKQVWVGVAAGLAICLCIGAGMIGAFYALDKNTFANTEDVWEGVFALIASVVITVMGAVLLRVSKLQDKWRVKLARALESSDKGKAWTKGALKKRAEKYAMFSLPFITVLREGLEAVVFIGGVGVGSPATAFPLPVILGLAAGCLVGFLIYKGGNFASMQIFLIISTCFLYLVAAGLFSRGVWYLQNYKWSQVIGGDVGDVGSGPGSYDIRQSVWHVNCCNPELGGGGGWGVFNALFGWTNSATYGSVISYNFYWIAVIVGFLGLRFKEKHGHWPLMPKRSGQSSGPRAEPQGNSSDESSESELEKPGQKPPAAVQEIPVARDVETCESTFREGRI